MKKLSILATGLLMAATASAQGQFPTEYSACMENYSFDYGIRGVWDEIVQGKPGQGLGLVAPGVKQLKTHLGVQDFELPDVVYEFYPNGLLKTQWEEGGHNPGSNKIWTYNYDKQWRLQNVVGKDGQVVYKYHYDDSGRLVKMVDMFGGNDEAIYSYDEQGLLKQIVMSGNETFDFNKDGMMVKKTYLQNPDIDPLVEKYDQQGRWKGYTQIVLDGMDEEFYTKLEMTVNYQNGPLPTSMTFRTGECNPNTKAYVGTPSTSVNRCTYQYDDHKNWITWKATGGYPTWTFTRTISYYTDEEVKQALVDMEAARKPDKENMEQEGLWEF